MPLVVSSQSTAGRASECGGSCSVLHGPVAVRLAQQATLPRYWAAKVCLIQLQLGQLCHSFHRTPVCRSDLGREQEVQGIGRQGVNWAAAAAESTSAVPVRSFRIKDFCYKGQHSARKGKTTSSLGTENCKGGIIAQTSQSSWASASCVKCCF